MSRKLRLALLLAAIALGHSGVASAADVAKGESLAHRWCSFCHVVAFDPRERTEAPAFAEIAKKPGFDANALAMFLLAPHPKMPDMGLSRNEAADLAAYIMTQRR